MAPSKGTSGTRATKPAPAELPPDHDDRDQQTPGINLGDVKTGLADALSGYDNMALWNVLKRTDPKATKPFQRAGGFRGNQIDPAWRIQMMTEVFGPIGKGWSVEQLEWTIAERMVFICVRIWYVDPATGEKHYTGPQWGGTEMVRRNRDGTERPDDECFKMSMTDAIGKCMLQIGLAADIYLGQFDDSKYREESEVFYTVKSKPELQPNAIAKSEEDLKESLSKVSDLDQLDELWRDGVNARIREIGGVDKNAQNRMIAAFSQKKNEILKRLEDAGNGYGDHPGASDEPEDADQQDEPQDGDQSPVDQQKAPPAAPAAPPLAATPTLEKMTAYMEKVQKAFKESKTDDDLRNIWSKEVSGRYEACLTARLEATKDAAVVINMFQNGANQVITRLKRIDTEANVRLMGLIQARRDKLIDDEPDQKSA